MHQREVEIVRSPKYPVRFAGHANQRQVFVIAKLVMQFERERCLGSSARARAARLNANPLATAISFPNRLRPLLVSMMAIDAIRCRPRAAGLSVILQNDVRQVG